MSPPRVSCVIATRDRWNLLLRALESARRQEGVSLEILVVDDGSSDSTRDLAPALEGVRYLRLAGRGAAAARNAGAAEARGEWLAFLDDDDEWLPGKLAAHLAFLGAGRSFGTTGWLEVDPEGASAPGGAALAAGEQPWFRLLQGNFVNTSTVLLRRDLFLEAGGFDASLRTAEDWDLWLRAARLAPLVHLPEAWTRSWVRADRRLTGDSERLWRDAIAVQTRHLRRAGRLPREWRVPVLRALADRRLQAAGAAWARRDLLCFVGDLARALGADPWYCLRHLARLVRQGSRRR